MRDGIKLGAESEAAPLPDTGETIPPSSTMTFYITAEGQGDKVGLLSQAPFPPDKKSFAVIPTWKWHI